MINSSQRVLITGAAGFIGAALAHALVAEGCDCHLLVRPTTDMHRLMPIRRRCTLHSADLLNLDLIRRAVQLAKPDVIFHLAAHGIQAGQNARETILATNFLGTANLLTAVADRDYATFVNVGSSSEYGHKTSPICASDSLAPRTDYAVAKAAATLLCQAESMRGRPVTTVRVFSAYGPGEDAGHLVPSVMAACQGGIPPQVTAGNQPRDFIYLDDVIDLLKRAANCEAAIGKILHAGSGQSQTVRQMVESIVTVSGSLVAPRFGTLPTRADEPTSWVAEIGETTRLTDWQPKTKLSAGVRKTWEWFVNQQIECAA